MKTEHFTNETKNFMHVGGVTIPPGETREVDAVLLPGGSQDDALEPAVPLDPLAQLMNGSVAAITAALPTLSNADLARATELEEAGVARKSMLAALSVENLRRVAASQQDTEQQRAQGQNDQSDPLILLLAGSVVDIVEALPTLSDADLSRASAIEQVSLARKSMMAAISAETLRRANPVGESQ